MPPNTPGVSVGRQPTFVRKKTLMQQKSVIFSAINKVKDKEEVVELDMEDDTEGILDEQGRTVRW